MIQYNRINVEYSTFQLNKLNRQLKNAEKIILRISSNMIGNSNDETNKSILHKSILFDRQFVSLRETFANITSTNIN